MMRVAGEIEKAEYFLFARAEDQQHHVRLIYWDLVGSEVLRHTSFIPLNGERIARSVAAAITKSL